MKRFLNDLTAEQFADLREGLVRKLRREAQDIAIPMGSAFAAELRVMGLTDEAQAVQAIVSTVLKWRAS